LLVSSPVGNSFTIVGIRPGSALEKMRAGRKLRSGRRCNWTRVRFVVVRGVRVDINFRKWEWGSDKRVSSIGYQSNSDCMSCCKPDNVKCEVERRRQRCKTDLPVQKNISK
jgi:hypothetical protein